MSLYLRLMWSETRTGERHLGALKSPIERWPKWEPRDQRDGSSHAPNVVANSYGATAGGVY